MINRVREIVNKLGLNLRWLFIPISLSMIATFFEGVFILALFPLVRGVINMDFSFVGEMPIFNFVLPRIGQIITISNTLTFFILIGIIFFASIIKVILQYFAAINIAYYLKMTSHNIRKRIFNRYLSFGKFYFDRNSTGYLHYLLMGFSEHIAQIVHGAYNALSALFMLLIYLIIMIVVSWHLTILMVVISSIFYLYTKWLADKIKKSSYSFVDVTNTINKKIFNFLSCIPLIKSYTNERKESIEFSRLSKEIASFSFSMDKKYHSLAPFQEIILLIAILFLVSAAAFLITTGRKELVSFLVYFYLIRRSTSYFLVINNIFGSIAMIKGPIDEVMKVFNDKDKYFINDGKKEFKGLQKCIDFKQLNFSYLKDIQILKNITFSIEKGEVTALVGPTGSGKTTLINLIARFYDCPPGSIYIDDIDIREFTLQSLMAQIALISQDIFLFNDSIKNNIIYGLNREISPDELYEAAKKSRIFDPIMEMPNKFETLVGDRGITLSGGEKQRIAIARALLKNAEILILDEATSALDLETERLIQEAIAEVIKGKTTIVIAHRLSTIKNVDKIIYIEDGKLLEHGELNDLLIKKGRFYSAWQEQNF